MEYHAYSPGSHIEAIRQILSNAKSYKNKIGDRLSGNASLTEDQYEDAFYSAIYVDASYSHIVATSLTTFFESLFFHEFYNLKDQYDLSSPLNDSPRWKLDAKYFWDLSKVASADGTLKKKSNFVDGLTQLFESLNDPFLISEEAWTKIKILFHYRNYVAHNGFEWRKEKIEKFEKLLKNLNGSNYFSSAKSGNETWILYLTEDFIDQLIKLAIKINHEFDNWFWKRSDEIN